MILGLSGCGWRQGHGMLKFGVGSVVVVMFIGGGRKGYGENLGKKVR